MHIYLERYFSFIKKFIPKPSIGNGVGIDIGVEDCKMVEIGKSDDLFVVKKIVVENFSDKNCAPTVKKLLNTSENPMQSPYVSVFGKGTLIRYIKVPRMSQDDLKKSFSIEADKYFPFAQDQIYTDCYVLDPDAKTKDMSVLAAAAKKSLVDDRLKIFKEVGVDPFYIGLNSLALANIINVIGTGDVEDKDKVVAILDMGEEVSSLMIMIKNLPWFNRDIFIGGIHFTQSISNALGISMEEAQELKKNPGDRLDEVLNICETPLVNIIQELKLSFDYFSNERNVEVNKILLTGGASKLENISSVFEKNLDLPTVLWNPFGSLSLAPEVSEAEISSNASRLAVALGLALYHYD